MQSNIATKIKVIALSSSPSKGRNSDTMLDHFIEGMKTNSRIEVEKIYLNDIKIDLYNYENRKGPLEHETEFKILTDKIKESHALIIATPTYNFSVPAQLKNFIDRIRFFALDFDNKTKLNQPVGLLKYLKTYFIVSGGTPSWAEKLLFFAFPAFWLRGVFLYYGSQCLGAYYTGDTAAHKNNKIMQKCFENGKKFADKLCHDAHNRVLEQIFWRPPQSN